MVHEDCLRCRPVSLTLSSVQRPAGSSLALGLLFRTAVSVSGIWDTYFPVAPDSVPVAQDGNRLHGTAIDVENVHIPLKINGIQTFMDDYRTENGGGGGSRSDLASSF